MGYLKLSITPKRRLNREPRKTRLKTEYEDHRIYNLFNHNIDIQTRRVYLSDEIEDYSVSELVKSIHYLESLSKEAIQIHICSPGGSVDQMYYLYDSMKSSPCPIITVGSGGIYSAATIILCSGNLRVVSDNSFFMAHQISNWVSGSFEEVSAQVEATARMKKRFWKILSDHTKKTEAFWEQAIKDKREIWLDSAEMLSYGIVDVILSPSQTLEAVIRANKNKLVQK